MTRLQAGAVLVGWVGFTIGCRWMGRHLDELRGQIVVLEANQDHELCEIAWGIQANYATDLEHRLRLLEQQDEVVGEAERITREARP